MGTGGEEEPKGQRWTSIGEAACQPAINPLRPGCEPGKGGPAPGHTVVPGADLSSAPTVCRAGLCWGWKGSRVPSFALPLPPRRASAFIKHLLYAWVLRNCPLALVSALHRGPRGDTASPTAVLPSTPSAASQSGDPLDTGRTPGVGT